MLEELPPPPLGLALGPALVLALGPALVLTLSNRWFRLIRSRGCAWGSLVVRLCPPAATWPACALEDVVTVTLDSPASDWDCGGLGDLLDDMRLANRNLEIESNVKLALDTLKRPRTEAVEEATELPEGRRLEVPEGDGLAARGGSESKEPVKGSVEAVGRGCGVSGSSSTSPKFSSGGSWASVTGTTEASLQRASAAALE